MVHAIGLAASLAIFWALLSGYLLPLIIALGVASIVLCVFIAHRLDVNDHEGYPIHLTLSAVTYYPWLIKEIVVSNLTVAKGILTGKGVHPQVIDVRASQSTDLGRTIYANSITLTPGTVSIAVTDDIITVHALMDETAAGLESGEMDQRVCRMVGDAVDTINTGDKKA